MTITFDVLTLFLLGTVSALSIVQIPIEVKSRLLSRSDTLMTLFVVLSALAIGSICRDDIFILVRPLSAMAVVVGAFALVHITSPNSLGLGDVILAAPLTSAVAFLGVTQVPQWLLIASISGSLHGIVLKFRTGKSQLPFGPHMLGSACLVLLLNL